MTPPRRPAAGRVPARRHPGAPWEPPRRRSALAEGFAVQARVIHALMMREMQTRFGRGGLGFLWLFIEPLLLAGAIATIHWVVDSHGLPGVSIFVFYLVGYLPYFAFRAVVSRAPGTLQANMTLLYHRQVRLFDVVTARHVLEMAAIGAVMGLVVLGVSAWAGTAPHSIPWLLAGLVLLMGWCHGLGMLASAAAARWELAERLIHPLVYLCLPISGAFFSLSVMPAAAREMLLWNPQVHFHEMVREGMFGDVLRTHFDLGFVLLAIAAVNLLGMAALRAVRPRLEF